MAVENKLPHRQLELERERLSIEFDNGLKTRMDIDKLQELFIHLLIATARTSSRSGQLKRLDQHEAVILKAKEIQGTHNTYPTFGLKGFGTVASVAAAFCGAMLAVQEANIRPLTAEMITLLKSGVKDLDILGKALAGGSDIFTSRESGQRELLNAEMRAIYNRQDQLGTTVQQYSQRIESLLAKADQLLRQQSEAKRG